MKQKIKEAVQQLNKTLGLSESTVDGLVAFAMTVVKDESEIEGFVNSEAFKGLLKSYQSEADKVRTKTSDSKKAEYEAKIAELEAKLNGNNTPEPNPETNPQDTPDFKAMFADALAEIVNPLKEELAAMKGEQSAKAAFAQAQSLFNEDGLAKTYTELAEDAWDRATELYESEKNHGTIWSAEQLSDKALGYLRVKVQKKGLNANPPFQSDGGAGDNAQARFEAMAKRQQERQGAVAE